MPSEETRATIQRALVEGADLRAALADTGVDAIAAVADDLKRCLRQGGKILLCGNGGSAADAQHIAAELTGRFERERAPLRAIALTTDTSALTAIANDYGYRAVFARQVLALGDERDALIAISTSGNSENVVDAVTAASEIGMTIIGLTGGDGGRLRTLAPNAIVIASDNTARIQECHIAIGHILCDLIETALVAGDLTSPRPPGSKVVDLHDLLEERRRWREDGRTVVWTNGCFDVLHAGHVDLLRAAKKLGDILIVGVNSDSSVRAIKGPDRPIYPADQRVEILAALEATDRVVVFDEDTPERVITELEPDIHCKGADYTPGSGAPMPEADIVASYGGRIELIPLRPGVSTTDTLEHVADLQNRPATRR